MHKTFVCAALALALSACAGAQRPMTLEEFYGFCWPAQIDSKCSDDSLCSDYQAYLSQPQALASKEECIKGCNDLQMTEYQQNTLQGCEGAIGSATDWCIKYCRLYFDYGPPKP
jgi:hypothetical protein